MQGGTFAANLTRIGEKANYDYLVRWVHNARQRTRPYCMYRTNLMFLNRSRSTHITATLLASDLLCCSACRSRSCI